MQKLEIPQALDDIRRKIALLQERMSLLQEGVVLFTDLADNETDPLKNYQYREMAIKRREELVAYDEQIRSQQVYLAEFENDLKQQQALRKKQLEQVNTHLQPMLQAAKRALKLNDHMCEGDRQTLKAIRERFIKNNWQNDEERISRFREMVNILKRYMKETI